MEEKVNLAPWEELSQVHEQISTPTGTSHPAEHISQAHEGSKEIKEEPILGAVVGGKLGATYAGSRFALEHAIDIAKKRWGTTGAVAPSSLTEPNIVKKWLENSSNLKFAGGKDYGQADLKAKIAAGYPVQSRGSNIPIRRGFLSIHNQLPEPVKPTNAYLEKVSPYAKNIVGGAAKLLGPVAAGAGAGYQGLESAQRFQTGDPVGGLINFAGGLGSLVSAYPTVPTMLLGTGTALSAEAINAYRDKLRRGEIEHGAIQQNVDPSGNAYATGGLVHLAEGQSTGKSDSPSGMQAGLQYLEELLRAIKNPEKTPVVPVPNRWFSQPDKFPQVQGLVEKALTHSGQPREAFHSGAFIDPRTGEVLDRRIYNNLGVVIDPQTGKPMMSVGNQAGIEVLDPKTGSYTKSNLVRKNLFTPTGGDPLLNRLPFIATIENKGVHHYGLGTQYATPTELYNTMKGENPTLRPRSRGEVFGMGDVVGQARIGGRGEPKNIYEKLFVAPKGSDVPGVRLGTTGGGGGGYINPINPLMGSGLTPFGMKDGGKTPESSAAFGYFPQMTPKRANPQGGALHGYLDALVGMPKNEEMSVLNPQDLAYNRAYDTAEPYGIATNLIAPIKGLATMGAAKMATALAGKGMLPAAITAWHGTPHKVQGGFDLAKVGTGEGNQTFGHGMYFAEKPDVAKGYQERLSRTKAKIPEEHLNSYLMPGNVIKKRGIEGQKIIDYDPKTKDATLQAVIKDETGNYVEHPNYRLPIISKLKPTLEDIEQHLGKKIYDRGNLYKVDIPDEQIPKMLDLDKPISEQMHVWDALHPDVKKAIDDLMETQNRNPISEVPEVYTGHNLYRALSHHDVGEVLPPELPNSNWFNGGTSYEKHASQYLNSLGIPGIKYLDQGSRGNAPIIRQVTKDNQTMFEVDPRWHEPNKKYHFPTQEEAKAHADSYGTRNFVSFEPSTVKILEENGNPLDILKGSK